MNNKEAIKYLIQPFATSTEPSAEYLKQKEAYELAIKALEERTQGTWTFDEKGNFHCDKCGREPHDQYATIPYCPNCGAKMYKD